MKYMNKCMSACALLIAVANCYGSQKELFYVKNDTSLPVYVGLYLVGSGEVTNPTQKAFLLASGAHATFARQSSLVPGRIQKFIFSASLNRLAYNVVKYKVDEYVFSSALTPNVLSYKITGDLNMRLESLDPSAKSGPKSAIFYNLKKEVADAEKERKSASQSTAGKANVRGKKIGQLEQRSQGLAAASADFADTARQLREQQEKEYNESFMGRAENKVSGWKSKLTRTRTATPPTEF